MRTRVSFYDLKTGIFTGHVYSGPDGTTLQANMPEGCGSIAGAFNRQSQRVDLATGQVVAWRADPPADTELVHWVWSEESGSYVGQPTVAALARAARAQRSRLFAQTAWVRERAQDKNEPVPQAYLDFWQALRDISLQEGFPVSFVMPAPPSP